MHKRPHLANSQQSFAIELDGSKDQALLQPWLAAWGTAGRRKEAVTISTSEC